ncbi:MAG TPA: hypothetical protein VKQ30_12295 [Ktedonobacterales bacterium]|nr:hypothetical protein [Ktedonobacterales bacterium]
MTTHPHPASQPAEPGAPSSPAVRYNPILFGLGLVTVVLGFGLLVVAFVVPWFHTVPQPRFINNPVYQGAQYNLASMISYRSRESAVIIFYYLIPGICACNVLLPASLWRGASQYIRQYVRWLPEDPRGPQLLLSLLGSFAGLGATFLLLRNLMLDVTFESSVTAYVDSGRSLAGAGYAGTLAGGILLSIAWLLARRGRASAEQGY